MGFSHLPEILILLLVALLVFGPKRMVEMGSQFGKAFRELRDATKEMNWNNPLSEEPQKPTASVSDHLSQIRRDHEAAAAKAHADTASGVVEGSVEPVDPARAQEPPVP
jgi:sec-independent protein translocase protein TatA